MSLGQVVLGLFLLLAVAGCGESGPEKATVKGSVTLDGTPVEKGSIVFIPTGGTTGPSSGAEIKNGTFETLKDGGPVLGSHRVEITAHRSKGTKTVKGVEGATTGPSAGGTVEEIEMYIPAKYNKDSELTLDVKAGENVQDFPLKSAP